MRIFRPSRGDQIAASHPPSQRQVPPRRDAQVRVCRLVITSLIAWLVATALLHRQRPGPPSHSPEVGEPRNRTELKGWLDVRIEELVAWRSVLDEETAKPVPNIDRTQSIEALFWNGLNGEVARKLQLLAPEWAEYGAGSQTGSARP